MRSYPEARKLIGTSELAGYAGGRSRFVKYREGSSGEVEAVMFETAIVTFRPETVEVRTGGYVTPSTFDGIAAALGLSRIVTGTRKRVPHLLGHRMSEGMQFDYSGTIVAAGAQETPLGPERKRH